MYTFSNLITEKTIKPNQSINTIATKEALNKLVSNALSKKHLSIDIEGNGFFRYPERVCLIQVSFDEQAHIIDPLEIDDLMELSRIFENSRITKIFHAGDYDIRSLNRDYSFIFKNVFDTSIGAAFLGSEKLGLDSVLNEYVQIEIKKDKKFQRSDWTIRPLPDESIEYAADDVLYLNKTRKVMENKLSELSRLEWVKEECVRLSNIKFKAKNESNAFFDVKGSIDLNPRSLAILKCLFEFREDEAIGKDRPPFKILSDSVLVEIARDPNQNFSEISGIGYWASKPNIQRLKEVIENGRKMDPQFRPQKNKQRQKGFSNKQREQANIRLKQLKDWRKSLGQELKLDPSLLWPTSSLSRLSRSPELFEQEFEQPEVRKWQIKEFGDSISQNVLNF